MKDLVYDPKHSADPSIRACRRCRNTHRRSYAGIGIYGQSPGPYVGDQGLAE